MADATAERVFEDAALRERFAALMQSAFDQEELKPFILEWDENGSKGSDLLFNGGPTYRIELQVATRPDWPNVRYDFHVTRKSDGKMTFLVALGFDNQLRFRDDTQEIDGPAAFVDQLEKYLAPRSESAATSG